MKLTKAQSDFFYIMEYLFLLVLGGAIYYGLECLWRGHSHVSMFFVGGLCFVLIGLINEIMPWDTPFWKQVLFGEIVVLTLEFVSGCILNLWLKLNVWDYSDMPFNLLGQICLPFALLWIPIIAFAIILDDWVKYLLFHGEKPRYKWI